MKASTLSPTLSEGTYLSSEYKIEHIDFKTFTDTEWDEFISYDRIIDKEVDPGYPYSPASAKRRLIVTRPNTYVEHYVIRATTDNFNIVGYAFYDVLTSESPDYQSNGQNVRSFFSVHPDHRRKGLGTLILKFLCRLGRDHAKKEITFSSSTPEGQKFIERFASESDLNTAGNRLYLKDINWENIENWHTLAQQKSPDTTIETYERIPDAIINDYATVETALLNDVPFGSLGLHFTITPESVRKREQFDEQLGYITILKITRESDGSISGMTDIKINSLNPSVIEQGLTGVLKEFRGRNLGLLLKSDMLLTIRERWPDTLFISTGNSDKNAPMLRINHALGYIRATLWKAYKFQIHQLLAKLP